MNAKISTKVGFCPSGILSQWGFVLVGFCPVGFCPSGVLSQWGFVLHSSETLCRIHVPLVWKFPKSMDIVQGAHGFSGHFTEGIIISILREQNWPSSSANEASKVHPFWTFMVALCQQVVLYTKLLVSIPSFRNFMMPASELRTYRVIALESYVP